MRDLIFVGLVAVAAGPADAAGVVSLTQERAVAGGITSGDGPGFPILITDPGSYRLDTDLYPDSVAAGIIILSPNVTLDLNGFRMFGGAQTMDAILGTQPGATIKNGTITKFQRHAIFASADSWTVDNMRIVENGNSGIADAITCGELCIVRDCTIALITGKGIRAGRASLAERNLMSHILDDAIEMLSGGMVLGNFINGPQSPGVLAIRGRPESPVGYGENAILNFIAPQTSGAVPLNPNACFGC